jgi:tetratricopeptide (TPR) repeat protein
VDAVRESAEQQRKKLRAALVALINQVQEQDDLSLLLGPDVEDDARRFTALLGVDDRPGDDGETDLADRYILGWLHFYRLQAAPGDGGQDDLDSAITMLTPSFMAGVRLDHLPSSLLPSLARRAVPTVAEQFRQILASDDPQLLAAAIGLLRRLVEAVPGDHPDAPLYTSELGSALQVRFERTGNRADLEEAVQLNRDALRTLPADHPGGLMIAATLSNLLRVRFERARDPDDLAEAARLGRAAVTQAPADYPGRTLMLTNLSNVLRLRSGLDTPGDSDEQAADLDEAIGLCREVLAAIAEDDPERIGVLSNLGISLRTRAGRTGSRTDAEEAVATLRKATAALPPQYPERAGTLSNLGTALLLCFELSGRPADLDEAIENAAAALACAAPGLVHRHGFATNLATMLLTRFGVDQTAHVDETIRLWWEVLAVLPPADPGSMLYASALNVCLQLRYDRTGVSTGLDEADEIMVQTLAALPADHPDRATYHSTTGMARMAQFERTGNPAHLEEAAGLGRIAAAAVATGHPRRAGILADYGFTLQARFLRKGEPADLDEAVGCFEEAMAATASGDPDRVAHATELANVLRKRFEHTAMSQDLEYAIQMYEAALAATTRAGGDRALCLSNLGTALAVRYDRTGAVTDLDRAIGLMGEAVALTPPDHHGRARRLSGLARATSARYSRTRARADLDEAVALAREALAAGRSDSLYSAHLGHALVSRFRADGDPADLAEGVELLWSALAALPSDHPERVYRLGSLGLALSVQYEHTHSTADLEAAVDAFAAAADVASATAAVRSQSALRAGLLAARHQPARAAALLARAVDLLPEVAPRQLARGDQQYELGDFSGLAPVAAALALSDPAAAPGERPGRALRLLEAGRAILISQALETRGDLTELTREHPALARRFVRLRDLLGTAPGGPAAEFPAAADGFGRAEARADRAERDRRGMAEELSALLAEIRTLPGHESFARPPAESELRRQAGHGPIVVFNTSSLRSDALLVTGDGVTSLPLPDLTYDVLTERVDTFRDLLHIAVSSNATSQQRSLAQRELTLTSEWLWDVAIGPVLDALGYTSQPAPGTPIEQWPRIWWVPGALLGLLPLHAAGHHADSATDPGLRTVLDRVVSSYTPTINALRHARRPLPAAPPAPADATAEPAGSAGPGPALIVAMPTTPGLADHGPLNFVLREARLLARRLPGSTVLIEPPDGPPDAQRPDVPTLAAVLDHLPQCPIAHFACHGANDPVDPSQSRLLLHDHETSPLTVAALAPLHLERTRLAYLSACETGLTTNARLLDEAVHLASAFQLAGYPHVIGTLWAVNDAAAAEMADDFYASLIAAGVGPDGVPETANAPFALHRAVRAARDRYPALPSLWAAHIHAGA